MKSILIVTMCIALQGCALAGNDQNVHNVGKVVAEARELFSSTRAAVGGSLEEAAKRKTTSIKDLDAVLELLDGASNKLQKATLMAKLDVAARQVETVRTQSVALLKDPANKAMAQGMDLQRWLDEIARQRSIGEILESDVARLRGTIQELRSWAAVVEPVAPPNQVASNLKARLAELLSDWGAARPASMAAQAQVESQSTEAPEVAKAEPAPPVDAGRPAKPSRGLVEVRLLQPGGAAYKTVRVTPEVLAVIKLVSSGTGERQTLSFIDRSMSRFNLTVDQIVAIRGFVGARILSAMIHHDGALNQAVVSAH
ncbi:MAG TPA: hypothetical protein VFE51_27605 [Verrucomicrobiae bacterium]|nr:hypothetical protein [Verrucomicrobiae bacterium]